MSPKRIRAVASNSMTAAFVAAFSLGCGQSRGGNGGSGRNDFTAGSSSQLGGMGGAAARAMSGSGATTSSGSSGSSAVAPDAGGAPSGGADGVSAAGVGGSSASRGGATGADGGRLGTGGVPGAGGTFAASGNAGMPHAQGGVGGSAGASSCGPASVALSGMDAVDGALITFNDNGGWSWFQDERALVDTKANKLLIGSVASGGTRDGYVEATTYDLAAKTKELQTISTGLASSVDDHNAPAFVIRPDGHYVAMYSGHRIDCYSRVSIFDGMAWSTEQKFDWTPLGCPWAGAATNMITYSNPWYLGTSILSAVRAVDTYPALITSADDGQSWSYEGLLTFTTDVEIGGYFKYWGNNTDRLDFIGTEAHPRDYDNNLWHGYVQSGMTYDSTGTVVDSSLTDANSTSTNAKGIATYTPVFATGTIIKGSEMSHAWDIDLVRYADATIGVIFQARADWTPSNTDSTTQHPDDRLLYARFDGTTWKLTYLVKAGPQLTPDEEDYTGLGALDPDDPNTVYVSSPYDPSTDTLGSSGKHEIWRGTTCDHGASFEWTPVTANSTEDNLRPIVPKWDADHHALLWLQGTYTSSQSYALSIVGLISGQ
jgi:hypothetical protein